MPNSGEQSLPFYAVIIAGGRGERFWPLSTSRSPKQLLRLFGSQSLLAESVNRLDGLIPPERRFLITTAAIRDAVLADSPAIPPGQIVGEPCGRDTAAAIAVGCALVRERDPAAAFCVLTADHLILPADRFRADLQLCLEAALQSDRLITIGIPPTFASEGFGYLETASDKGDTPFLKVRRFVEKPDRATAETYIKAGNYFWNSGMFIWSVKSLTQAFENHRPDLCRMMDSLAGVTAPEDLTRRLTEAYKGLEKTSIDYALMEKAANVWMRPAGFEWHDVGSWSSVADHFPRDESGNTVVGACEILDSSGNIVVAPAGRLVALLGVRDLVVVNSDRATLVCRRDLAQDVKRLVERLGQDPEKRDFV